MPRLHTPPPVAQPRAPQVTTPDVTRPSSDVQTHVADTRLAVDATNTDRFHAPQSSTRPAAARAPTVDTPRAPGPTPTQAADRLYRAMYGGVWGFGADRRVVLEVLAALTPDALAEVRHHYRAHYGRDLDADVARKLPKRDAAKADARLRGQAELADVLTLRGALRGLRKDAATALSILERAARTGQSHAFAERFALETGTPLTTQLRRALSGAPQARALALAQGDTLGADAHLVAELLAKRRSKIPDALLVQVLARGGAALAARYQALHGQTLDHALGERLDPPRATQARRALTGDDVGLRASGLARALAGDTGFALADVAVALLDGTSPKERAAIEARFLADTGRTLEHALASAPAADQALVHELLDTGHASLASELHAARGDVPRLLALLESVTDAARADAHTRWSARHDTPLEAALVEGLDGLDTLRVRQALDGPPKDLDDAVARARALRDALRAGPWNAPSRALLDWLLLSKKGAGLDATIERAEVTLEAARADGFIDADEHAALTGLVDYASADLDTYRDAVRRVVRVTSGVAGTLAASAAVAATSGAGAPLAAKLAASALAGGAATAATTAVAGGRLYTLTQLRHAFGLGAATGAGIVLGQAATRLVDAAAVELIADKVFGASIASDGTHQVTALTRRLATDFAIGSYDAGRIGYGLIEGAVRGGVGGAVGHTAMAALDAKTWKNGRRASFTRLAEAALDGAKVGVVNGAAAALAAMALGGLATTHTLDDAEARKLTHPISVDTPSGPHEVVVLGELDAERLQTLRTSLQQMSDVTHGQAVAGLETVHVFDLAGKSAGMCLGPNGFAIVPDISLPHLVTTTWHESGHRLHTQLSNLLATATGDHPFGKPPFVTDYAATNLWEDVAETHEELVKTWVAGQAPDLNPATNPQAPKLRWVLDHLYPGLPR